MKSTYEFFIEYIKSLMEAIVGDGELLFEARCARESSFGIGVIRGNEESACLFELFRVRNAIV